MILNDLFESRMSELDIEYQDYKNLEPVAFYSRYKMSKDQWASKHWSLIKSSETVHEESQDDRNARIIAGEIEDAMSQGNEKVAQEKIKRLTQLGYYFDKQGRLQRMGMYEQSTARERWNKASAEREKKHADAEKEMKARHARGEEDMKGSIDRLEKALNKPVAEGIPFDQCPNCGGSIVHESQITEKQDACYHKVKSRYKVWPSAYASGALVQCRKKGAANWGTGGKKK
jgi:hypothetical protein